MESNMDENVKTVKRTKEEKKLIRKQVKASHTLLKHEGINTVSMPTKSVVVANGGLGNGVQRETLMDVMRECGHVESLLMPPNKPYAFVTYNSVEDAKRCQMTLSGTQLHCQEQVVTLYICFVEKVNCKFALSTEMPPGLKVVEDFVSMEEEAELLACIDWESSNDDFTAQKTLKHRRVKHYGYEFRYDNNNVDKDKPLPGGLPGVCQPVLERCLRHNHVSAMPDQLTVNQYQPGQGIPPHVDTHSAFEDTILSLSLGAKAVMDFRHPDGGSVAVVLPERSLLVMAGESRYLWSHGITPRKFDVVPSSDSQRPGTVTPDPCDLTLNKRGTRTSFTFRKVRHMPCDCAYPSACDSQRPQAASGAPSLPRCDMDAALLESQFVHAVYEEIAGHFSSTRHSPWPRVGAFLRSLPPGVLVLDIGCGNGKYLGVNPDIFAVGCDRSCGLVQICADRGFQAFASDALNVPLRSGVCDACISIAVIHHFSTQERRLMAIKEVARLLRPGGRALIYVWALEQEYNKQRSKYLKENKETDHSMEKDTELRMGMAVVTAEVTCCQTGPPGKESSCALVEQTTLGIHTNRTAFSSQDVLVPWHLKGGAQRRPEGHASPRDGASKPTPSEPSAIFHRYYHVFREGELEDLCQEVENVTVRSSYHDQGNWCVILEKTAVS